MKCGNGMCISYATSIQPETGTSRKNYFTNSLDIFLSPMCESNLS